MHRKNYLKSITIIAFLLSISAICDGQIKSNSVLESLFDLQYSMIIEDLVSVSTYYATEDVQVKYLEKMNTSCADTLLCWMIFNSGDSLLLFQPTNWPDQKIKKATLKSFHSFMQQVDKEKKIPYDDIMYFNIELIMNCIGDSSIQANYILTPHSNQLIIERRKVCFAFNHSHN